MADLLVKLYNVNDDPELFRKLESQGIRVVRALSPDFDKVKAYILEKFGEGWASEASCAFTNHPCSCYIAIKDKQIIGFGCYNATTVDFFGPTGVSEEYRSYGIGKAILIKCMLGLKELGYGYAIIGDSSDATPFYQKVVGAVEIPDSFPGVYSSLVNL